MKLLRGPSPVVPCMTEKDVPRVRQGRSVLDAAADRCKCPHLGRRVHHGRTGSRPPRPCAATGPTATALAAPAAPRLGVVGRGGVRSIATVATVAATACRAGRCPARCAMAQYWCCASSHVANDTEYRRRFQALAQSYFAPDEPLAELAASRIRE